MSRSVLSALDAQMEEGMTDMVTNGDEVGGVVTTMAVDAGRDANADSGEQDEERENEESEVVPRP